MPEVCTIFLSAISAVQPTVLRFSATGGNLISDVSYVNESEVMIPSDAQEEPEICVCAAIEYHHIPYQISDLGISLLIHIF
ncbi:hypothetical protein ABK730_16850 [Klebsiella indica]|uniref:hypothetical protein n=1 Tax=Klebsiella TaxID=570 RepID=UPI0026ADEA8C